MYQEISVSGDKRKIIVDAADVKQIQVDSSTYIVPGAVANLVAELTNEISRLQTARVANDEVLDARINKRASRIARALSQRGYLIKKLDEVVPLPPGWESDVDHIFEYDVVDAIKAGLKGTDPDLKESLLNTIKTDY